MRKRISNCYVNLWGQTVGAVVWSNKQAYFEYDQQFIKTGLKLSPIYIPLSKKVYSFPHLEKAVFQGFPGILSSSLPDSFGNKLINKWLRFQGVKQALNSQTDFDTNLEKSDKDKANDILDIIRVGTSAGGAVPKAIIAMDDYGNIRSGQGGSSKKFKHYILKFDRNNEWVSDQFRKPISDTKIEYAYHLIAKEAGINMTKCALLHEENGRSHFITERFDRVAGEK